jgi:hypothetical protein
MKIRNTNGVKLPTDCFKELPGVKGAWQYRGRIYLAIKASRKSEVEKCLSTKLIPVRKGDDNNGTLIVRSKWIHPRAQAKQEEVRNAIETKKLVEAHYEHLQHLLSIHSYSDEEYEQLDGSESPYNLQVSEGYQGHYYKEDFDLERASKQEGQLAF